MLGMVSSSATCGPIRGDHLLDLIGQMGDETSTRNSSLDRMVPTMRSRERCGAPLPREQLAYYPSAQSSRSTSSSLAAWG